MKGDFSRSTFRQEKHYAAVRIQQGRVQVDADWNEQIDIADHRTTLETGDVIGLCGAPTDAAGFALVAGATPQIGAGRFYVDGILCENDAPVELTQQPDLPAYAAPESVGHYLAYLDVWRRHVTALEDEAMREVALGGPDTATRVKTIWQVKLLGPFAGELNCTDEPPAWQTLLAAKTGALRARSHPGPSSDQPCIVPPGAGYQRLENQLYRVEIHRPGPVGVATFKWSRDNASIVTRWLDKAEDNLIVQSGGRDAVLGFGPEQTVELSDETRELRLEPGAYNGPLGTLVRLKDAEGQLLALDPFDPVTSTVDKADFPDVRAPSDLPNHPKVRRWDSDGETVVEQDLTVNDGWLVLEDGVEIFFEDGFYNAGDYWLIPARTATGDVEWPFSDPQPPLGIDHHYCKLAILHQDGTGFSVVQDCRPLFPPLTRLTSLLYAGGDGQEAMPGQPLALPLTVRVVNGQTPVAGARIAFTVNAGGGTLAPAAISATDAEGIAATAWTLGASGPQQVEAVLLDSADQPVAGQRISFGATLSIAAQVAYDPAACANLVGVSTVQEALDILCRTQGGGCCVTVGEGGEYKHLAEAIEVLIERGETNLCLCLLANHREPFHPFDGFSLEWPVEAPELHITINGCGSSSRVLMTGPFFLRGARSATLRNVAWELGFVPEPGASAFFFDHCPGIAVEGCSFMGVVEPGRDFGGMVAIGSALMMLTDSDRSTLHDNTFEVAIPESMEPEFAILLKAGDAIGRPELALPFELAMQGVLGWLEWREAALQSAMLMADLDPNERAALQQALAEALGGADNGVALSRLEQLAIAKLRLALGAPEPKPRTFYDILVDWRLAAIKTRPGTALVLESERRINEEGEEGLLHVIEDIDEDDTIFLSENRIAGIVGLYGFPAAASVITRAVSRIQGLKLPTRDDGSVPIGSRLAIASGFFGSLQVRGNQITRIALPQGFIEELSAKGDGDGNSSLAADVFGRCLLADNVIEGNDNILIARRLSVDANDFNLAAAPMQTNQLVGRGGAATFIGVMLAGSSVYVGNQSGSPRGGLVDIASASERVANLNMTIV